MATAEGGATTVAENAAGEAAVVGPQKKEEGMATLFVSLGKAAGDLLGMFYREGKIPDNSVGRIQLFERHSLVDADEKVADKLYNNLSNSKLRNQRFRIGHDRMG